MKHSLARSKAITITIVTALLVLRAGVACSGLNDDLMKAADQGDLNRLKHFIIRGADVNARRDNGETALMRASRIEYPTIDDGLLAAGVNTHDNSTSDKTAAIRAYIREHPAIAEALLVAGAGVNNRDDFDETGVTGYPRYGRPETVRALLAAGQTSMPGGMTVKPR